MKLSMSQVTHLGITIHNARFSRINPESYREGIGHVALKKQITHT